jgi:FHS family L-fucose permease-like MFS transporter
LQNELQRIKVDAFEIKSNVLSTERLQSQNMIEAVIIALKKPLEQRRMIWLTASLFVVIGGLLYAFFFGERQKVGWGAMQYPQLTLGMLAIFVYVGVEVAIGSNLGELLKQKKFGGYKSSQIAPFIAMFWGSLMIGRWTGAINAFRLNSATKKVLMFVVPLIAFGIILLLTKAAGYTIEPLYWYSVCVIAQIIAFYLTKGKPALTLGVFGTLGVISTGIGLTSSGLTAVYALLSGGLFCSIMWPAIFSLSLAGLGKYQSQGSAFLVMMILGGAIIPPIQGKLSDIIGIQPSFVIVMLCFGYLAFFAMYVRKLLIRQGISFNVDIESNH